MIISKQYLKYVCRSYMYIFRKKINITMKLYSIKFKQDIDLKANGCSKEVS